MAKALIEEGLPVYVLTYHIAGKSRGNVAVARSLAACQRVFQRLLEEWGSCFYPHHLYAGIAATLSFSTAADAQELMRRQELRDSFDHFRYLLEVPHSIDDLTEEWPAPFQLCSAGKDVDHTKCEVCCARGWYTYDGLYIDGMTMEEAVDVLCSA